MYICICNQIIAEEIERARKQLEENTFQCGKCKEYIVELLSSEEVKDV